MPNIHIIPQPVQVTPSDGHFELNAETVILAPGAAERTGHQLAAALAPATGYWLPVQGSSSQTADRIDLALDDSLAGLGPEGYRLTVTPQACRDPREHRGGAVLRRAVPPCNSFRRRSSARRPSATRRGPSRASRSRTGRASAGAARSSTWAATSCQSPSSRSSSTCWRCTK